MKQIFIFLSLVLLSSLHLNAQKTISKADFEKLVDYANTQYVMAFIEKNDAGKPYFADTYIRIIRPELEKATLENFESIISFQSLIGLLAKNEPALKLARRINDRKGRYDEFSDNRTLIHSLSTTGWNNIDLSRTAAEILNSIFDKYNLQGRQNNLDVSESEIVKTQTIQTSRQVEDMQQRLDALQQQYNNLMDETKIINFQKSFNQFRLIAYAFLGIILILLTAFFLHFRQVTSRDAIIKLFSESKRVKEMFVWQNNSAPYKLTVEDYENIANKVKAIIERRESDKAQPPATENSNVNTQAPAYENSNVNTQAPATQNSNVITQAPATQNSNVNTQAPATQNLNVNTPAQVDEQTNSVRPALPPNDIKYLTNKSDKTFKRAENTPENSFFKLFNERDGIADFDFSGDAAGAIAKRIFCDKICTIKAGSYKNAKSVSTIKPGKIKRVGDYWEVTEKLQIKLT